MAILLYQSGILEEYRPKKHVFTEEEILHLFSEYAEIKTVRIPTILNTWGVYGSVHSKDLTDLNRIASEITERAIYTHILFIHDSELNLEWNVTDNILYKSYSEFVSNIKNKINEISLLIMKELEESAAYQEKMDYLPQLVNVGQTSDNRLLFSFNPDDQTKEFYNDNEFYMFSQKVYDYLINNIQKKEPFTIYADKRAVIIIEKTKVKTFLTKILEKFKTKEEYEICENITKIMNQWTKVIDKSKKTRNGNVKK
jgi:hypothetical protein